MYDCMMVLRSTTAAQRAGRLLATVGVPTVTTRPPASVTGGSCSHAVKFDHRFLPTVQATLAQYGIPASGTYCISGGKYSKL